MEILKIILQLIVGLGILNVWLLRFNKKNSLPWWKGLQHERRVQSLWTFRNSGLYCGLRKVFPCPGTAYRDLNRKCDRSGGNRNGNHDAGCHRHASKNKG